MDKTKSIWSDFGPDHDQAKKDAERLSGALGKPVVLAKSGEIYYCTPAVNLIGKDLPENHELISYSR